MLKDNSTIRCNFNQGEHILHSEDKQYNTIIDFLINSSEKIQEKDNSIIRILEEIEVTQNKHKKTLDKIEQNLDYLKSQEVEIDRKIQYLNHKFNLEKIPTKLEIEKLIKTIIERPKELEVKTTQLISKLVEQVENITTEIKDLQEITKRLEEISLS